MSFQINTMSSAEYIIPSKPYYMRETTTPLDEIRSVSDNLSKVPAYFVNLHDDLALRRRVSLFGQFDAPTHIATLNKVHGKSGFFLKKTIKETGIDFIWHDKENAQYLFWGSTKLRMIDAMNRIRSRIIKYVVHMPNEADVAQPEMIYNESFKCTISTPSPSPIHLENEEEFNSKIGKDWWSIKNVMSPSPSAFQVRPIAAVNKRWFSRKEERQNRRETLPKKLNYSDNNYDAILEMLIASPPPLLPPKSAECCESIPQGYSCVHARYSGIKKPIATLSLPSSPAALSPEPSIASTPPPAPERTSPPPILRSTSVAFRDETDYMNMKKRNEYPFNMLNNPFHMVNNYIVEDKNISFKIN
jgi:hypothetical protein